MNPWTWAALSSILGYFAARFLDELLGLDALAADLAAGVRQATGIPRLAGGA